MRYKVIDRMLRNQSDPFPSKMDLLHACIRELGENLCEKTIDNDLADLRYNSKLGYFAPIEYSKGEKGYHYTDPNYSIEGHQLDNKDLESVLFVARLLNQYKDIDVFGRFLDTAKKIRSLVKVYRFSETPDWAERIEFEKGEERLNAEHWDTIMDALRNKDALRVKYQKFSESRAMDYIVHPYHLKEYRNRWYLIGLSQKSNDIRVFGLDRIKEVRGLLSTEFRDHPFNSENYYRHVIGITVENGNPVDIRVAFSDFQAQYILTQPLHHSQRELPEENGRRIFGFNLIPNFEFYAQILAWGTEVEVLEPSEVRNKVVEIAKGILEKYKG